MNVKQAADVFGRVGDPFKLSGDVGAIEAAPDIILSQLLGTMADLLEQCCVGQQAVVLAWRDQANDERAIIVLPEVGQRQHGISEVATGGRAEANCEARAIVPGPIYR